MGKGVTKAVASVNGAIAKAIAGMDPTQQVSLIFHCRPALLTEMKRK